MNAHPRIKAYTCPCCGGSIGEAAPIDTVIDTVAHGQQKFILETLAKRIGRTVSKAAVMAAMFDHRADGGPEDANGSMNVQMCKLRKTIDRFGWSIVTSGGGHGSDTFYRLIPTGEM